MAFPTISTSPAAIRYYNYLNERRGIVSSKEKAETEKKVTQAKVKKAVSECAIVASAIGLIYFGFKRSFRVDRAIKETKYYEMVQKMKKPEIMMPLK